MTAIAVARHWQLLSMEEYGNEHSQLQSVEDILVDELRQLYSTAQHILDVVPDVLTATPSFAARKALNEHMEDTKTRLQRLNQRCERLGIAIDALQSVGTPSEIDGPDRGMKRDVDRTECRFDSSDNATSRNRMPRQTAKVSEPPWLYAAR